VTGKGKAGVATSTPTSTQGSTAAASTLTPISETPVTSTAELSLEEAQNQANETLADQERSVAQLRVDLELSSDTSGEGSKAKTKSAQRPKLSDIEPSSDEAEVPAQKPKKTEEPSADPTVGVPEIVADFQESIVISEEDTPLVVSEEEATAKPTSSASTATASPVPSWMTVPAPVPLTDIHVPPRLTVRLSIVPYQSRSTKKTPSTPEKKGTMIPYAGITPFRSIGPTSLSSSQVYRVILSMATTTSPTGDHDHRLYTNYSRFYRKNYILWIVET